MARIRKHFTYADTRAELVERKDARRGACEDAFWDEDELVDFTHRKKNKKKKRKGCPGNDGGPHIYVWTSWAEIIGIYYSSWYDGYEVKACCGCKQRAKARAFRRKP